MTIIAFYKDSFQLSFVKLFEKLRTLGVKSLHFVKTNLTSLFNSSKTLSIYFPPSLIKVTEQSWINFCCY
jgi:hypothetical protein